MWYVRPCYRAIVAVCGVLLIGGCSSGESASSSALSSCAVISGDPWVPQIDGIKEANHDDVDSAIGVKVMKDVYLGTGKLLKMQEAFSGISGHIIEINNIKMDEDLLAHGSLSLVAEVTGFPANLASKGGVAWPVLISLSDGTQELVNVQGCDSAGFFTCVASQCVETAACGPKSPSAFLGSTDAERKDLWSLRQNIWSSDAVSTNTFPTCNWSSGTPQCPFTTAPGDFFSGTGKLKTGTYTAKYVLLSNFISFSEVYQAGLKLTVVRKRDGNNGVASKGAIDLNVVLVGSKNISDSRTLKGKQNLNALFSHVLNHYSQTLTGISIGKITVFEWTCENGGDAYANTQLVDTGKLFAAGSAILPTTGEGRALNIFLVSSIPDEDNGTILGRAGGIPGAIINGTTTSGLVFASFDKIATFNPKCSESDTACLLIKQESFFIDMGSTISHEMGHYLGLNHPSESSGTLHDTLPDTPKCTTLDSLTTRISINSCRSEEPCQTACPFYPFCPDIADCQFNHVMWWTSKNYGVDGIGDGNFFSSQSSEVMNFNGLVQ